MLERNVRVTFCSDVRIMTDGASHSRNKKTASHRSTNSVVTSPPCRPHPPSPLEATLPHVVVVAVAEVVEEEAEVVAAEEVGDVAAVKAEVVAVESRAPKFWTAPNHVRARQSLSAARRRDFSHSLQPPTAHNLHSRIIHTHLWYVM